MWGGLGEWVAKNMRKGDGVTLQGRARWHSWENDQGQKRTAVEFTADSVIPRDVRRRGRRTDHRATSGWRRRPSTATESPRSDVPEPSQGEFVHQESHVPSTGVQDPDDIPF